MKILGYETYVAEKLNIQPVSKARLSEFAKAAAEKQSSNMALEYTLNDYDKSFLKESCHYDDDDMEVFQMALDEHCVFAYDRSGKYYTADEAIKYLDSISNADGHYLFLRCLGLAIRHESFVMEDILFDASDFQKL